MHEWNRTVKKSRYTEQQIAVALQQVEAGATLPELCRQMGISEATFYRWKQRYARGRPQKIERLRQIEDENTRLRKLVTDLMLELDILREGTCRKA
jgi:putative transposase